MLESLESRKLLSATLNEGLLVVEGTAEPDRILIRREGDQVVVNVNGDVDDFDLEDVLRIHAFGFAGNDRIVEHELNRPSTIFGGAGNDWMLGAAGNDVFWGGDGHDAMDGRLGADQFNGGGGVDLVTYATRATRVVVSMNGVADDGTPATVASLGERDNVKKDVEALTGGRGNDTLYGNELANRINGAGGNDTVWAGAGNDTVIGGRGNDRLAGQDGNDTLLARDEQKDLLFGGGGQDRASKDAIDETESVEVMVT